MASEGWGVDPSLYNENFGGGGEAPARGTVMQFANRYGRPSMDGGPSEIPIRRLGRGVTPGYAAPAASGTPSVLQTLSGRSSECAS